MIFNIFKIQEQKTDVCNLPSKSTDSRTACDHHNNPSLFLITYQQILQLICSKDKFYRWMMLFRWTCSDLVFKPAA